MSQKLHDQMVAEFGEAQLHEIMALLKAWLVPHQQKSMSDADKDRLKKYALPILARYYELAGENEEERGKNFKEFLSRFNEGGQPLFGKGNLPRVVKMVSEYQGRVPHEEFSLEDQSTIDKIVGWMKNWAKESIMNAKTKINAAASSTKNLFERGLEATMNRVEEVATWADNAREDGYKETRENWSQEGVKAKAKTIFWAAPKNTAKLGAAYVVTGALWGGVFAFAAAALVKRAAVAAWGWLKGLFTKAPAPEAAFATA